MSMRGPTAGPSRRTDANAGAVVAAPLAPTVASMSRRTSILGSLAWMALIFLLSALPGDRLGPDDMGLDAVKKVGHFVLYGVLAVLYLHALKGRRTLRETGPAFYVLSLCFAVLYAASDEYHQSFVPGRHAAVTDVIIDASGACAALGTVYMTWTRGR